MLGRLVAWVEDNVAPGDIVIGNAKGMTRPLCLYPAKLAYRRGDRLSVTVARDARGIAL